MDWFSALCFSVPIALALAFSAWRRRGDAAATKEWRDGIAELIRETATAVNLGLGDLARAQVTAAKYAAGVLPKEKPMTPGEEAPFDQWLDEGGRSQPQRIQDAVEWSMGRLAGTERDDELGRGAEFAERYLMEHAPGFLPHVTNWAKRLREREQA